MINSRSQSRLALDVTDKFLTGILRYINLQCKDSQLNNFRFLIPICFLIIMKYHLIESCFSFTAPLHWIYCLPLDLQNVKYRQNSGMYERVVFFPGHNNFDKGAHHSLRRIHAPVPALALMLMFRCRNSTNPFSCFDRSPFWYAPFTRQYNKRSEKILKKV